MKVTPVRTVLAICFVGGAAAATISFLTSSKISASLPVGKGIHPLMITWAADARGASFQGSLGNVRIEGNAIQPEPFFANFVVTGAVGSRRFRAVCSGRLLDDHLSFHVTGTIGTEAVHATARLKLESSDRETFVFNGTVGGTAISGTIPLPASNRDSVTGTVSVG